MILNHADAVFCGRTRIYRIYFAGRLVWTYGVPMLGHLTASLLGLAIPGTQPMTATLMESQAGSNAGAIPAAERADAVLLWASAGMACGASAQTIGIRLTTGTERISFGSFAAGHTYGLVFSRGLGSGAAAEWAGPHWSETIRAAGAARWDPLKAAAGPRVIQPVPAIPWTQVLEITGGAEHRTAASVRPMGYGVTASGNSASAQAKRCFTVTFMCDGAVLCEKTVAEGSRCGDPVTGGEIASPWKSNGTLQYVFDGWSSTEGGAREEGLLEQITENRTVYTVFKALPLGTLDNQSWAAISARSKNGTAQNFYRVGDSKTITMTRSDGSPETILVTIAGFGLHRDANGVKDGITWISRWCSSETVSLTTDCETVVLDTLPRDLRQVIRPSLIDTYTKDAVLITTTPYVFLPEMTNISTTLTNPSGGSDLPPNTFFVTVPVSAYTNAYDADLFPLFEDMSKEALAAFFGLDAEGDLVSTRTLAYGRRSNITINALATVCFDTTYTLVKNWTSSAPFTFCFRV